MPAPLFYLFALIMLVFGVIVVVARNPVASAMSLVVCFVGLAVLFLSLDAYFIGTIQILVYAGAVMVLLDIKAEAGRKVSVPGALAGVFLAVVIVLQVVSVTKQLPLAKATLRETPLNLGQAASAATLRGIREDLNPPADSGREPTLPDTKLMGYTLVHRFPYHLQIVGLLLLVGTVGVVVLSRRDREEPQA
jgi:NADH-quinone oxidoreductase subunit J